MAVRWAHSKVDGWASLMAGQMVSQKVALWDAKMVDWWAVRWEQLKVAHLAQLLADRSEHQLVALKEGLKDVRLAVK